MAGWLIVGGAIMVLAWIVGGSGLPMGLGTLHFRQIDLMPVLGVWIGLNPVPATVAIADAVLLWQSRDLKTLQRSAIIVKIAGIPYFALISVLVIGILYLAVLPALGLVLMPGCPYCYVLAPVGLFYGGVVAPVIFLAACLTFLPTAVYGVACLALLRSERVISRTFFVINVILQFLCLGDLVSTSLMINKANRVTAAGRGSKARADAIHASLFQRYDELEGLAARGAAERSSPSDHTRLGALHGRYLGARSAGELMIAGHLSRALHKQIWLASGDRSLRLELDRATGEFWAYRIPPPLTGDGNSVECAGEHEEILRAIRDRRPDDAERLVRDHLRGLRAA